MTSRSFFCKCSAIAVLFFDYVAFHCFFLKVFCKWAPVWWLRESWTTSMNVCFHGRSVFKYVGNLFPLLMTEKFRRCPSDHFFSLSVARVTPLHDKALAMSKIMHVPSVRLVLRSQKYDFFLFFLFAVEWKCWFLQLFWREAKTVLTTPQKMIST